jgi:hypothetical protein
MGLLTTLKPAALEGFEPRYGRHLRALRAILPAGTEFVDDPAAVPAEYRYRAGVIGDQFSILPEDPRLATPAYYPPGDGGAHTEEEFARFGQLMDWADRNGAAFASFGLAVPPGSQWPIVDLDGDSVVLVLRSFAVKSIAFFVRRDDGGMADRIVKLPLSRATYAGCMREFRMLELLERNGLAVAPAAIDHGWRPHADGGGDQPYTVQSFLSGAHSTDLRVREFIAFLKRLGRPDEQVTAYDLARRFSGQVDDLDVSDDSKSRLRGLLDRVTDRRALPAAIGHGDFSAENLIDVPGGGLMAIDWEFAHRTSANILDFAHAIFRSRYVDERVTALSQVFSASKMSFLEKFGAELLPDDPPPVDQLCALHFAQNYIDRVAGFGGLRLSGLVRLDKMLHSDWPL